MKHTLVVVTSNRNVEKRTAQCLDLLVQRGAGRLDVDDIGDVTLARNVALTRALLLLQREGSRFDCVLLVDDDMVFSGEQAQQLVDYVRHNMKPASAAYVLGNGRDAFTHYQFDRWTTGAGFLCLHRQHLEKLAIEARRGRPVRGSTEWLFEFCTSGFRQEGVDLVWEPEDTSLTRRLGGVVLLPIGVGHVKRSVFRPSDALAQFITDTIAQHPPRATIPPAAVAGCNAKGE